jgi:predicted flap endonuclease-1-like 5' DNA nuclease
MVKLVDIEGIGPIYAQKLKEAGIRTVEDFLQEGSSPAGRKAIAEKTGITDRLILVWVNRLDLFRIQGVGEKYVDLLEAAGVDTVSELAQRNATNLHARLVEAEATHKLVRKVPNISMLDGWINQAKSLAQAGDAGTDNIPGPIRY